LPLTTLANAFADRQRWRSDARIKKSMTLLREVTRRSGVQSARTRLITASVSRPTVFMFNADIFNTNLHVALGPATK
jgi:hypothetical protein